MLHLPPFDHCHFDSISGSYANLHNHTVRVRYRAGLMPAAGAPSPQMGPDSVPNPSRRISPRESVEIEERTYIACPQSAARHYEAVAGRTGPGAALSGDPYGDCKSARQAWIKALVTLNPAGGLAAAEAHVARKFDRIAAQTAATWQQAYNDSNHH